MSRVLVTGAAGFVGANLVRRFAARGDEVHAVARATASRWRLPADVRVHEVDLCDPPSVVDLVKRVRPRVVLHFAAHTALPQGTDDMEMLVHTVQPLVNLAAACASDGGCEVFVNAGSSSEYGYQVAPMAETSLPDPTRMHDIAKLAQTLYATHTSRLRELPIVTLRLFSVYGPFEHGRRLVPRLMRAALRGAPLSLSSPDVARDFIHVDDVGAAVEHCVGSRRWTGEVFNLGSGVQHTLRDVVARLQEIHGRALPVEWGSAPLQRWDSPMWVADTTRQFEDLGWRPRLSFADGLRATYDWFGGDGAAYAEYAG